MTPAFTAGLLVGWFACAAVVCLLIGAVVRAADRTETVTVQDPETGAVPLYIPQEWFA